MESIDNLDGNQPPHTDNPDNQQLDLTVTDEESKIREDISNDFKALITRIKYPFNEILTLRKNKIKPDSVESKKLGIEIHNTYFKLNEEEEQDFFRNLTELNETLGAANSTLDSYIKFTKSSPDFEKFLNMFYIFVENYANYRSSFFFQFHAEKGNYLYPYFEVDNVFIKLQFLFARLCGTLSIGARWMIIQPPSSSRGSSSIGDDIYNRDRPYHDLYDPYRFQPYNEPRPKYRDIGDSYAIQEQ